MTTYGGALAKRLYGRYANEFEDVAALDDLMRNDAVVALIQFLFIGIKRADLKPDEVTEALQLAEAGRLLKSSNWLRSALVEYRSAQAA